MDLLIGTRTHRAVRVVSLRDRTSAPASTPATFARSASVRRRALEAREPSAPAREAGGRLSGPKRGEFDVPLLVYERCP